MTLPKGLRFYFAGGAWPGHCDHCGSWKLERAKYRVKSDPRRVYRICNYCARGLG
jgi:hypothetical protein